MEEPLQECREPAFQASYQCFHFSRKLKNVEKQEKINGKYTRVYFLDLNCLLILDLGIREYAENSYSKWRKNKFLDCVAAVSGDRKKILDFSKFFLALRNATCNGGFYSLLNIAFKIIIE